MIDRIPDTRYTQQMRLAWELICDLGGDPYNEDAWAAYYAENSIGGTPNGRAVAALLFYRALNYWPDYFTPADGPPVAAWADMLDMYPFITPDVIEAAVDAVHAKGIREPQPKDFIDAANEVLAGA